MAKRFTDSEKWKKPFIRAMKAPYKLLWLYILDECDHAGIWQVDFDVAQIKIGEKLNMEIALKQLEGKIFPFDSGEKWFIPDFIEFQYGTLNPENRAHKSVLDLLTKYNLLDIQLQKNKPLTSPLQGAKDMDKDKELDKDKDKESEKNFEIDYPFKTEIFKKSWQTWIDYKKIQYNFSYKSGSTEQIALNELAALAERNELQAIEIINTSITNGWKGLFKKQNQSNGKPNQRDARREPNPHGTTFGQL